MRYVARVRFGPLRRRYQPVSQLVAHALRGLLGATSAGAVLSLARSSRATAGG